MTAPATPADPEPVITLDQLTAALRMREGQVITNGAGLAIVIMSGVNP